MLKKDSSAQEQAAIFSALADSTRLKLLKLLTEQQETDALCVNALAYRLGITQSAVSQHLKVLKNVDLVKGEKRGYRVHYFVNWEGFENYLELSKEILGVNIKAHRHPLKNG